MADPMQNQFDPQQQFGQMAGAGLGNLLAGSRGPNPFNKANQYLQQIPGQIGQQYDPYIQSGQNFIPGLTGQYNQLMEHPGQRLNEIGGDFQQSPGYQFALQQALNSADFNAAGRGLGGSPEHEQRRMQTATGLANQDYYNYLNQATGLYGQGLQGAGHMYDSSLHGTDELAQSIMDTLLGQAGTAYGGAINKNQNLGGSLGAIGGALGGTLGGPSGASAGGQSKGYSGIGGTLGTAAGTAFGGPLGGLAGGALGSILGGLF